MNNWYRLGDFVSKSLKGITPKYVIKSDIIVLNQKCIRNNKVDYSYSRNHDPNKKFNKNKILRIGDLLFNSTGQGTAGRCCFIKELPEDKIVITDSHILVIRIKNFYLAESFSFALFKEETLIQTFIDGSTGQGELDKLRLFNIQLRLPEGESRKRICDFLGRLNRKIELNTNINAELEATAKLIYDYWFEQFDFPMSPEYSKSLCKPELAGKPYKSSSGKMVYNNALKQVIPEGWEDGIFDDVAKIIGGSTPSKDEVSNFVIENGTPWITPKDLSLNKRKKFISRGEIDVTEKGIKNASLKLLPEGSVLLSSRAPIGYLAIARQTVTTNQGFKSFVPKKHFTSEFLYYQIKNKIPLIEACSGGSTFKEVSGSILKTIKVVLPPEGIIESYQEIIKPIFKKQNVIELENKELEVLRDWLLPMLMNGQVTVGKTEEIRDELKMITTQPFHISSGIVGTHIVNRLKNSPGMGRTKFQKVLHLAEYTSKTVLGGLYYQKTAGPHNDILINHIENKFKTYRHIKIESNILNGNKHIVYKATPRTIESETLYKNLSEDYKKQLDYLIDILEPLNLKQTEAISTLYAVWNNRIIENLEINNQVLIKDFYNWSDRKKKEFQDRDILHAMEVIKKHNITPNGWGCYIGKENQHN